MKLLSQDLLLEVFLLHPFGTADSLFACVCKKTCKCKKYKDLKSYDRTYPFRMIVLPGIHASSCYKSRDKEQSQITPNGIFIVPLHEAFKCLVKKSLVWVNF